MANLFPCIFILFPSDKMIIVIFQRINWLTIVNFLTDTAPYIIKSDKYTALKALYTKMTQVHLWHLIFIWWQKKNQRVI